MSSHFLFFGRSFGRRPSLAANAPRTREQIGITTMPTDQQIGGAVDVEIGDHDRRQLTTLFVGDGRPA